MLEVYYNSKLLLPTLYFRYDIFKRLGHADTVTKSKIYAHAIKSADEAAAETLENLLTPSKSVTAWQIIKT